MIESTLSVPYMKGLSHIKATKIVQLKKGQRIALLSTILILFLAVFKGMVGCFFHSPLLVADAWHSGSDIMINLTSLIGLWLAAKKKSDRFPYGLYRAETMACFFIGFLIFWVGLNLAKEGIEKLFLPFVVRSFPVFPMAAAIISCGVAWYLAIKQKQTAIEIGSQALMATSRESFYDIFTSLFVLIGILLGYIGVPYVEGLVIIIISILILRLGIITIISSMMILIDANLDIDLHEKVSQYLNEIYGVKGVSHVKIRQSGPFKMVECIIKTSPSLSLYKSHQLADKAEILLMNKYENIESVFIHVEPDKGYLETAILPVLSKDGLNSKLYKKFARAPFFIVLTLSKDSMDIQEFLSNKFINDREHLGLNIVKSIIKYKINVLFVESIGEIAFHTLKNSFVDIYKTKSNRCVKNVLTDYQKNRLLLVTEPTQQASASNIRNLL